MTRRLPRRQAFTLIELLTVIAIIALLAGMIFGVVTSMQKNADRTVAVSNLKQLGAAIVSYTSEHDGRLPGPIFPGQVASYSEAKKERLTVFLSPYLGIDKEAGETAFVPVFAPPAFRKSEAVDFGANDARTLVANLKVLKDNALVPPFGSAVDPDPEKKIAPMSLADIPTPESNWALSDADQTHPHVAVAGWKNFAAKKPYHGDKRVALFYDWHVEALALDEFAIPTVTP
jgi:prepilin-type N-terminal cleavage/methylation domain-containing protein/prepilin-type processing-associated H-X9-DG protein